ncbi:MgtC/SapB family protein [Dermabacteraceae bacterium TAE3-ERU27]|nr:MgtC/SapB family protein [Dermabacteraceae bacterium TAE3-ERU27]
MKIFSAFASPTVFIEVELLIASFLLCSLIGVERQVRRKSAGYRTNVLVGLGSCGFTLISAYGFSFVFSEGMNFDPSRISAQIVSGIGFLGAGVIFKGKDVVRGLTTAATVWVSAAVGMACGAGMLPLAITLTALHLVTLFVVSPLVRRLPSPERHQIVEVVYADGAGVLREILALATSMGFAALIEKTRRSELDGIPVAVVDLRFHGKPMLCDLATRLSDLPGVRAVSIIRRGDLDDESGT